MIVEFLYKQRKGNLIDPNILDNITYEIVRLLEL
jgi:hypothetical protein